MQDGQSRGWTIGGCQISYYTGTFMAHDRVADRARGGLTTYRRTAERWEYRSQPQADLHKIELDGNVL